MHYVTVRSSHRIVANLHRSWHQLLHSWSPLTICYSNPFVTNDKSRELPATNPRTFVSLISTVLVHKNYSTVLMFMINLDWENWNNKHSNSFLMQNTYWVPRTYEVSVIFKWNIPICVTITIFINIFSHNQHTLYEQFHYMATSFDLELPSSSSGHDTRIWMYRETEYHKFQIFPFYILINFTLIHFTYIFNVILM